jgi:hypothetical protein
MQMTQTVRSRTAGAAPPAAPISYASCVFFASSPAPRPFDPDRNCLMDSPPRKPLETLIEGRTSPELYCESWILAVASSQYKNAA